MTKIKSGIKAGDKVRVNSNTSGHGFEVGSVVCFMGNCYDFNFIGDDFNFIGEGGETWWLREEDWEFVVDEYPVFAKMTVSQRGELLTAYLDGEVIEFQISDGIWPESLNFPARVESTLSYRIRIKTPPKIEVGGNYTSKCGYTWVCIFIKDDSAWLTNKCYGSAAYMFGLDGKAKCLGSDKEYDIDLTQQG